MLPYWLMFLIPTIGIFSPISFNRRSQLICWVLVWVFFTLAIGYRHEVGGDWFTYLLHLERREAMTLGEVLTGSDPGYYAVNWLVAQLGGNIYWVNLISGAIVMTGLLSFARNQPLPWLTLAVAVPYLVIVVAMGYTRQGAALGLLMLGLVALSKGQLIRFVIWVMLGAAFHKSAVLMLPIAALASTSNRMWSLVWVGVVSLVGAYLFVFESADRLWENYVVANYESQGGLIRVLMNAVPAVLFIILHKRLRLTVAQARLWWWMSIFALVCLPLVMMSSTATDRVALYLIPLQLFVFSRLPLLSNKGNTRAFIILTVLGYYALVQFVWLVFASHSYAWLPYQMSWFLPNQLL